VRTAINHVIVEHSLTIPNVFTNLKIKGAGATKHDRLPLSDDQVVILEAAFSSDDTAWGLYVTLRDTGARVSEISGLRAKDCDLGHQCLHLTATPWRSLKTNNSERSVPLSHTAATALAKLAQGKDPEAPLFPNYAKDRGAPLKSMVMKDFPPAALCKSYPMIGKVCKPPIKLCDRTVFDTYDEILDKCAQAWNFFVNDPERISSTTD
jgi:integrase